ncbi:MAG TPA: hypothetical protein PLY70_05875 [Saprospiraceae bacterium]|nr:hypothetical protein [Saprospiraceae bacterium]HPN68941.1 hypothetical protein [Saprospiraceae bacterium]
MKGFLYLVIIVSLASCQSKIEKVERAFYYWKSDDWNLSDKEQQICDDLDVQKLYIKFFEVDYNEEMGGFPISKTRLGSWQIKNLDLKYVVPTVYLRNEVFLKLSKNELDILADNVNFLINKYKTEEFKDETITEFQMDCDWTPKTKDNYFYFLQKLKSISGKQISCTLRLYPYKYREKMGVPPVDRVTLMCYNLLSPLENSNKNSILDLSELKSYLKDVRQYPKHVDIALPIYSWAQVYHDERFSAVLYTDTKQLKTILKQEKPLWYTVLQDTVVNNTFLRVGDNIKYEEIDDAKIKGAITLLKQYIEFDKYTTVTLFHLDELQFKNFTNEELSAFYTDFSL